MNHEYLMNISLSPLKRSLNRSSWDLPHHYCLVLQGNFNYWWL